MIRVFTAFSGYDSQCLALERLGIDYELVGWNFIVENKEVLNTTPDGLATTLTTAHHYSGNIVNPKRGQKEMGVKEISPHGYRIRKLTPRECFRLMGVSDPDIDTIQAADISRSQQYKLAGNSIVVDVLAEIFCKMFVSKGNESNELTLF